MISQKSLAGSNPVHILSQAWELLISLTLVSSFDFSGILRSCFFFHFIPLFILSASSPTFFSPYVYSFQACRFPSQSKKKKKGTHLWRGLFQWILLTLARDLWGLHTCWELEGGGWDWILEVPGTAYYLFIPQLVSVEAKGWEKGKRDSLMKG